MCKASGVLKSGVHCLTLFKEKDEEVEMLHLFSQILTVMEPRDLMDMFSLCMPELFDCMISNAQLVHLFRRFCKHLKYIGLLQMFWLIFLSAVNLMF